MRLVHYKKGANLSGFGVILQEEPELIYEIPCEEADASSDTPWALVDALFPSLMEDLVTLKSKIKAHGKTLKLSECSLTAAIPVPRHDVVCVGLNYKDHVTECHKELDFIAPEEPTYFSKRASQIYGDGEDLKIWDAVDARVDYEVELAVIIGKKGRDIPESQVKDYILGYAVYNDLSARTVQKETSQWYRGKSLDGLSAMSSFIVLAKSLAYPPVFSIKSTVNGEIRQNSNTNNFIHSIDYLISRFSQGCTLEPGDIFLTGTPAGVGMGMNPPQFLKVGDTVTCEIESVGTLTSQIVK